MAVKKLIVCGDSFAAPSKDLPGTAHGELLAKKLGWDVQILARQGCSNGGIRVQIDEVLRQRPDFAIIAPTFHDRMEIPASNAPYKPDANENKGWASDLQLHLQANHGIGYDPAAGIDNVNYGNNNYRMICETIFSLVENYDHPYRSTKISKDAQVAMKQYINFLYDSQWKLQQDKWIIRDGIMQLFYANIPFLLVANTIWNSNTVRADFPAVVDNKYFTLDFKETPAYASNEWELPDKSKDPGYHTLPEGQEYLANIYYNIITERFGIAL
jgi:hypothetical protein